MVQALDDRLVQIRKLDAGPSYPVPDPRAHVAVADNDNVFDNDNDNAHDNATSAFHRYDQTWTCAVSTAVKDNVQAKPWWHMLRARVLW